MSNLSSVAARYGVSKRCTDRCECTMPKGHEGARRLASVLVWTQQGQCVAMGHGCGGGCAPVRMCGAV